MRQHWRQRQSGADGSQQNSDVLLNLERRCLRFLRFSGNNKISCFFYRTCLSFNYEHSTNPTRTFCYKKCLMF